VAYAARMRPGYAPRAAAAPADPKDFLARVVMHISEPRVIQKILQHLAAKAADGRSPPASTERHPSAA